MATNITETESGGNFVKSGICKLTGATYRVEVPLEQYENWRNSGALIQRAMPQLSDGQREFLMTGITPAEWDAIFDGAEEDEDGE